MDYWTEGEGRGIPFGKIEIKVAVNSKSKFFLMRNFRFDSILFQRFR